MLLFYLSVVCKQLGEFEGIVMKKLNEKYFENMSDIETLTQYGEELIKIPDYFNYDLSREQLQAYAKATIANFVDYLLLYLKRNSSN